MYTEDDEDVKIKKKNSNEDYNDFYTSFNEMDEKEDRKSKNSKKKEEVKEKDEEDYSDFYGSDEEEKDEPKDNEFKKKLIKIGIIVFLAVLLIVLLFILFKKSNEPGDIELSKTEFVLNVGEKDYISYKVVDTEKEIIPSFTSTNPEVATVDANGEIIAVSKGDSIITVNYSVGRVDKEKKCTVKVNGPEIKHEMSLNLKASTTNWTNKDVTVTVDAKTDTSITSLKYAINCNGSCTYSDVKNNKIVVSNTGVTKVTVVAKDKSNLEVTKEITTKIDREAPSVTYSGSTNITSNKDVSVCVTCSDSGSGCKQAKVCKTFTSSKSNQIITVYDNAGNSKNSPTFNVTINKMTQSCSLKVSKDGVVSATLGETGVYYGFNADCTGSNELSKKITISASKKGEKGAKVIYYYVKYKNGNIGSCFLTVIKECTADNVCSFRAS